MYQRRLTSHMPLEKVCFRMQTESVEYIRSVARESGLSQSAVLNAIILDFVFRQAEAGTIERSTRLQRAKTYAAALVSRMPKNSLNQMLSFCQDHVPSNL